MNFKSHATVFSDLNEEQIWIGCILHIGQVLLIHASKMGKIVTGDRVAIKYFRKNTNLDYNSILMLKLGFLIKNPRFHWVQEIGCCGFHTWSSSMIFGVMVDDGYSKSSLKFGWRWWPEVSGIVVDRFECSGCFMFQVWYWNSNANSSWFWARWWFREDGGLLDIVRRWSMMIRGDRRLCTCAQRKGIFWWWWWCSFSCRVFTRDGLG
jgi:hypothetical protein